MKEPVIEFADFSYQYKSQQQPTLKGITLTVRQGEKVLIVGPSGSGKTTMGNCINGLIPFSYKGKLSGTLKIAGKSSGGSDLSVISRTVGTVLQDTDGQFVGLSVGEDVAFALENACMSQPDMKALVAKTSAMVGMEEYLSQSPFELSGGQKQRVSLAGILVDDVDCLLFDEPLANLDPKTGKTAIELIDEIHRKTGKTVIIIEHRLEDVLHRHVDRIILMEKGTLVLDQSPHVLLASSVLKEKGIREPLYITALKYAGCRLREEDRAAYLDTLNLERFREDLLRWFAGRQIKRKEPGVEMILEVKGLSYSYNGERQVLKDISFPLRKGEMISILGKNGAGKSTLSKIIMGILKPDSGAMLFEGEDLIGKPISERSRKIGFVMQNPNHMISHHMIYDEVAFGLLLRGEKEDLVREKTGKILKLCGLYPFRNWPINALSYGQRKRVTIASILVMDPHLLILDEPTAGQDYHHYTEIMEFLKDLNENLGITIIMVTHDMHLALEYTNRSIVLSDGELICDDRVAKVFSNEPVIREANLKLTSLYELARMVGIENPDEFIDCFIQHEKGHMVYG